MTTRGRWFAQGSCLLCGQVFAFDPERVCSFPWPPPDGPARPICQPCITEVVNPERRRLGLPQYPILPGAYLDRSPPPGGGVVPAGRATQRTAPRRHEVIYGEHHSGPEQTDAGRIDWRPGWYAACEDCGWSAGPCLTEADAHDAADAHDLVMGEVTLEELGRGGPTERPAEPGKLCTCGRQAIVVYLGSVFGPTGYCGIGDGGDQDGPCPFCGGPRHKESEGRCPAYRLRLDQP